MIPICYMGKVAGTVAWHKALGREGRSIQKQGKPVGTIVRNLMDLTVRMEVITASRE